MHYLVLRWMLVVCAVGSASAQSCPKSSEAGPSVQPEVLTLEGQLIFHDGIRKWFELKLSKPQCGQVSSQLMRTERDWAPVEVLRGCRVKSKGPLDFSPTGYYSLDMYQDVQAVGSVGKCERKLPFPDYSKEKP